jgi:hypothetical protein
MLMPQTGFVFLGTWLVIAMIQLAMNRPYPHRVKISATWAVALASLSAVGFAPAGSNYLAVLAIALLMHGLVAALVFHMWVNLVTSWHELRS